MTPTQKPRPRFSVVIPSYRRPKLLLQAVSSVVNQSYRPTEVIVVESPSKSTIDSGQLSEAVLLLRTRRRMTASEARNEGASNSTGDYIAFLDDDDLWDHRYLEEIANYIMSISATGSIPDVLCGTLLRDDGSEARSPIRLFAEFRSALWTNPGVTGSNLVVERDFFHRLGGFDARLKVSEDRDFVVRALELKSLLVRVPPALAYIRDVSDSRLSSNFLVSNLTMLYKHRKLTKLSEKLLLVSLVVYHLLRRPYKSVVQGGAKLIGLRHSWLQKSSRLSS